MQPLVSHTLTRILWRVALVYLVGVLIAAATIQVFAGDGLDHLNGARWLLGGVAKLIDHRPPTLTVFSVPLAFAYELLGLRAETVLLAARLSGGLALATASIATAAAYGGRWRGGLRPLAALLVASSPMAIAVAPVFYQNIFEAAGVGVVLFLYRRLHQQPSLRRAAAVGFVAGCVALIRWDSGIVLGGVGLVELLLVRDWRRLGVIVATAASAIVALLLIQFGARHGIGAALGEFVDTMAFMRDAVQVAQTHRSPFEIQAPTIVRMLGPAVLLLVGYGAFLAVKTREPLALVCLATLAVGELEYFGFVTNTQPRFQTQFVPPAALLACVGLAGILRAWAPGGGRKASALVAVAVAWPLASGAVELWAFTDPAYFQPVGRTLSEACDEAGGRTHGLWLVGANHYVRPERRGSFVDGDHSTRSYTTGLGLLNFYARKPVYWAPPHPQLWYSLLQTTDGAAAVLVPRIDFTAWPLERTGPVRVVSIERDELLIRDGRVVGSRGGGGVVGELDGVTLRLQTPRDLGTRHIVLLGPEGASTRSLGPKRLPAGTHELLLDGKELTRVVLIGAQGKFVLD